MKIVHPSCATPADVDLRSTLSVAQSLSTIICNVSIPSQSASFNVQSRAPMKHLQMRFALCMSRTEGHCNPLAHSLTFSNDEHQFAHNCSVQTVFSKNNQRRSSSCGTLDSDRTPGECTRLQFSKYKLSKSFAKGLTKIFHCHTPALTHSQGNLVTLGKRPPLQLSAVGDRSLMWVCHITGTPGCSRQSSQRAIT